MGFVMVYFVKKEMSLIRLIKDFRFMNTDDAQIMLTGA